MLSAFIIIVRSCPAMPYQTTGRPETPTARSSRTGTTFRSSNKTLLLDSNQPVSRRSKPSSRSPLMGEQPHPWVLLHTQDGKNRHRSSKPQGRYGLLPATTQKPPSTRTLRFVRPGFRLWISYYSKYSQAGLCPYTLQWISVPLEPTFGRVWYLFKRVPPQPNCPSTNVHNPK